MLIKNVQALIKLGADVDAKDVKGNTCLHLCITTLAEKVKFQSHEKFSSDRANSIANVSEEMNDEEERIYNEAFEKLKEIGKELLFSGAQRSARNNNGDTPLMLLHKYVHIFKPFDFAKMKYVLSTPKGCSCLRLTRPIEKVERTTTIQVFMLLFDVINMAFFIIAASYNQHLRLIDTTFMKEEIAIMANTLFFALSILFYCLTLIDPGYVPMKRDFLGLMERLVNEELHLDYVCINCENLRPENTRHCNYCNKCVQGFDHHCTFVNNCLGYRNHKFFLLFLLCFTFYMAALIFHCIFALLVISSGKAHNEDDIRILKIIIDVYLLIVVAFHAPIVCMQNYS